MPEPNSSHAPTRRVGAGAVLGMLAAVIVPAAITLNTIRVPGTLQLTDPDPTPHGYTWSLLLFGVPILVLALWFLKHQRVPFARRAFWWTIGILVPLGFGLDFWFGNRFFRFPNAGATLRIGAPALGGSVPIEEYLFYTTGFLAILLTYVWLDEFWLSAYNVPDYPGQSKQIPRLLQFHPTSALLGVGLIGVAVLYKKLLSPSPEGFPGYFTFLVAGAFIPAMGFFPTARPFINWRAFSLTLFLVVLVSLLWEATLAVPYGWWGYQPRSMLGLTVGAWAGLPVEAVFVWIAVTYSTAIVFETLKLWQASGRKARHAFLGSKHPGQPSEAAASGRTGP
jgi:hypothetical protein